MSKKKKASSDTQEFSTLPIIQADKRNKATNAAIPSDENVKRAKEWVDNNKK